MDNCPELARGVPMLSFDVRIMYFWWEKSGTQQRTERGLYLHRGEYKNGVG